MFGFFSFIELNSITAADITTDQDLPPKWKSSIYFVCTNMEVISLLGRCNNVTDCLDGSDELNCIATYGMLNQYSNSLAIEMQCLIR